MTDTPSIKRSPWSRESGSFGEIFVVALPLMISAGSQSLMNMADSMLLAGYSTIESDGVSNIDRIAALMPAAMLYWSIACIATGTILYANTFVSQFDGANEPSKVSKSLWQAVWLALVAGALMLIPIPFSQTLFELVGHSPAVVKQETIYFDVLTGGSVFMFMSMALSCYFGGRRRTVVVMLVSVSSVFVNGALDYGFIYGHGILPELGIGGAALSTVLARGFEIIAYVVLICRDPDGADFFKHWRPDTSLLKKYVRFGVPSGLHFFVDNSGFLAFLMIVGSIGVSSLAATNLAFRINSLIFIPLVGFGTAVQTVVGHHIGAGKQDTAVRTTWNAIGLGVVWTGTTALILILMPNAVLSLFLMFTDSDSPDRAALEAVLPTAKTLLCFVAVYSVFDALAVVFSAALRGAGDTLFPMLLTLLSSWFVMTIPAWLLSQQEGATVSHLWITCTAHITLMGFAMGGRFLSGKWRTIKIVD